MRRPLLRPLRALLRRLPRPLLLFAPSLLLGLVGGLSLLLWPLELEAETGPAALLLAAAGLTGALLGGAWLLERALPSFRHAGRLLERALLGLRLTWPLSVALALATALSEELFFRGALLGWLGVWPQALLFGLLHPATRRGWSYTAYSFLAGLAFGFVTLWTGSLWAAIIAHFVVNLQGFLELRARQRRRPRPTMPRGPAIGATPERRQSLDAAAGVAPETATPGPDDPAAMSRDDPEASPETSGSALPPLREPPVP